MKINGTARLNAPADQVWTALNDPDVLVRTIPGCERLEALTPERFRMTVTAGVASIKGSYTGEVELSDPRPPHAVTLRASGAGAPGTVSAEVRITLTPAEVGTTVDYDADAVVGGAVGGVGQRVLAAVSKRTAAEFFAAVDAALAEETTPQASGSPSPQGFASTARQPIESPTRHGIESTTPPTPTSRAFESATAATPPAVPTTPRVFTRPAPATPALPDPIKAALVGAGIALTGVLLGWLLGRHPHRP